MASTKLTRAYGSGVTGNRNKWTISGWYKLDKGAAASGERTMLGVYSNGSYFTTLAFLDDGRINFMDYYNGGLNGRIRTNALHRDVNGWYHVVGVFDKDNSTSGDKMRLWVNGVRITGSLAQYETMPSQASTINSDSQTLEIGTLNNTSHFGGIMSHLHFCDGYAYDASYFGSVDNVTGEWKINTSPSVSYGTQGWFWLKNNNATTDNSPNSNTFTVSSGTLTKSEDCPSNVFATWNYLDNYYSNFAIQYGNLEVNTPSTSDTSAPLKATIGVNSGKYYWEVKCVSVNTGSWTYGTIGITSRDIKTNAQGNHLGSYTEDYAYYSYNGHILNADGGNTGDAYGNTYTAGDIIGVALDLDNNKLYFSKNGTWQNSGVPTSGSTGTGAVSINAPTVGTNATGNYFPAVGDYHYSPRYRFAANFGNGTFQTTAVSSAGTNASGNGIFEYDVPTGYTALSTKGLNL